MSLFWNLFQLTIIVGFLFADVYFEWGMGGLAAFVSGGLIAYHSTRIVIALRSWVLGVPSDLEAQPQWRIDAGRRLAERKASRSRGKLGRDES